MLNPSQWKRMIKVISNYIEKEKQKHNQKRYDIIYTQFALEYILSQKLITKRAQLPVQSLLYIYMQRRSRIKDQG